MKVYDLLNAGPRHRFTVRGKDGRPFLVSNCVQAIAADILREQLIEADTRYRAEKPSDTIRVVMQTHDEIVCVIPKVLADDPSEEGFPFRQKCLSRNRENGRVEKGGKERYGEEENISGIYSGSTS